MTVVGLDSLMLCELLASKDNAGNFPASSRQRETGLTRFSPGITSRSVRVCRIVKVACFEGMKHVPVVDYIVADDRTRLRLGE